MPPLAYLITWTTYGTWLPGDPRGWVEDPKEGILPFDPERQKLAKRIQRELPVTLDAQQRRVVDQTIVDHCEIRRWMLPPGTLEQTTFMLWSPRRCRLKK